MNFTSDQKTVHPVLCKVCFQIKTVSLNIEAFNSRHLYNILSYYYSLHFENMQVIVQIADNW